MAALPQFLFVGIAVGAIYALVGGPLQAALVAAGRLD